MSSECPQKQPQVSAHTHTRVWRSGIPTKYSSQGTHTTPTCPQPAHRHVWGSSVEHVAQDWKKEGGRLARARLSTGHEVPLLEYDGDRVLLDGSGTLIAGELESERGKKWELGCGKRARGVGVGCLTCCGLPTSMLFLITGPNSTSENWNGSEITSNTTILSQGVYMDLPARWAWARQCQRAPQGCPRTCQS